MARLDAVCEALAVRLRTVIPYTAYPAPNGVSGNQPMAIVYGGSGSLTYKGGSEQEWMETIRVQIIAGTADTPSALGAIDALVDPVSDLFSPDIPANHTLNGLVDFCHLSSYSNAEIMDYGEKYYGGTMNFTVKRRRFAGDA